MIFSQFGQRIYLTETVPYALQYKLAFTWTIVQTVSIFYSYKIGAYSAKYK
jgi:hypothetical protein